jgi:hypothetical protein
MPPVDRAARADSKVVAERNTADSSDCLVINATRQMA